MLIAYMNANSVDSKITELQATITDFDCVFIPETWLTPHTFDCGLLPGLDFTIYRRVRNTRAGEGVMLAVKNNIQSFRRPNLEYNAEVLVCELRPEGKRKILAVVFYSLPDTDLDYLKELKKSLLYASRLNFHKMFICGDFNLPNVNWSTCTANSSDSQHNYFAK